MPLSAPSIQFDVMELCPKQISQTHIDDISGLTSQLSGSEKGLTMDQVQRAATSNYLFVACCGPNIVGMAVLVPMELPQGLRLLIESVVVDESYRRSGIGSALITAIIAKGTSLDAPHINLTSNPTRVGARAMFADLGFCKADTSVFRRSLS